MTPAGPRFSVVVPVYQGEAFLADAVASIHAQGVDSMEVIVVDDGSTDGTADVARGLAGAQYIRRENGGIAAARNTGIAAATGEFLAFLDSDDLWPEASLRARYELLVATPEAHMAFGPVEVFEHDGPDANTMSRPDVARGLLAGCLLLRRADFLRVGLFDEQYRAGEFLDWYGRAEEAGLKDVHVEEPVLRRRVHAHNTVRDIGMVHLSYTRLLHARLQRRRAAADG